MGKAATRRNARRQEFLARLAQEDPQRFKAEWTKRLESWAEKIRSSAKEGRMDVPPVFRIVDRAKETLRECGKKAEGLELRATTEALNNECCRALAPHISRTGSRGEVAGEIYRLNAKWDNNA